MQFRVIAVATGAILVWFFPIIAKADSLSDLPEKVLSQCGIASALMVAAIIYLAASNAKTRSAWEEDRRVMAASYDKLAVSHAKLEGMVLTLQTRRDGGDC